MPLNNRVKGFTWLSFEYQLLGGIFFAVVMPLLVRYSLLSVGENTYQLYTSGIGSLVAFLLGVWILQSITTYPGVEATSYVIPAVSISYSVLFITLIVSRFPYNRAVLVAGWIISCLWFLVVHVHIQRHRRLSIGIVPPCASDVLHGIKGVQVISLINPGDAIGQVDAVMADLRVDIPAEWDAALADYALAGIPVYHLKHLKESLTGRVELEHISENSFGSLTPLSSFMIFKRVTDWITALLAIIILAPLLMLVGIVIRLTSPGPALFCQKRIGYRGRPFTVYKFRTMTVPTGQTEARAAAMTRDGDKRITKFGFFLRRTRIDELPQVINILQGQMSWIGPRPEAEVLSEWYQKEIPFYRYRHIVVPGLTGWAQVNQGHVTNVAEVNEKLHFDFYYIKHFSLWIDILIIVRTIATIFSGFGAR